MDFAALAQTARFARGRVTHAHIRRDAVEMDIRPAQSEASPHRNPVSTRNRQAGAWRWLRLAKNAFDDSEVVGRDRSVVGVRIRPRRRFNLTHRIRQQQVKCLGFAECLGKHRAREVGGLRRVLRGELGISALDVAWLQLVQLNLPE